MTQRPLKETRTPDRPCRWEATAVWRRRRYVASSRSGAAFALARLLVDAGAEDGPVEVGGIAYRSLHRMAGLTVTEGRTTSVRTVPYVPFPSLGGAVSEG